MFDRWIEAGLLDVLVEEGAGCIVFSPLAQGLLTNRYLDGIPADSRAVKPWSEFRQEDLTQEVIGKVRRLNEIAQQREQTLAQMAMAWVLRRPEITSAVFGASRPQQVQDIVGALKGLHFSTEELAAIEDCLTAPAVGFS